MPDNAPFPEFLTIEKAQRAREKTIRLDPIVAVNYLGNSYSGLGNIDKKTKSTIDGLFLLLNDICSFVGKELLEPLYMKLG